MDPIKHLYEAPSLVGKLAKWLILLIEIDVQYLTKKMIKGRAITEFLDLNPILDSEEVQLDFLDDLNITIQVQGWHMYFDGAMNQFGVGIRVILLIPEGEVVPIAKKLAFRVINNKAEYEACALGMEALIALGMTEVEIFRDSMLLINQAVEE